MLNNTQLISTYIRQGEELRQKILMVLDMAKNSLELPMQIFGPIMADIGSLAAVVQMSEDLSAAHTTWPPAHTPAPQGLASTSPAVPSLSV